MSLTINIRGAAQLQRKLDRLTKLGARRAVKKATRAGNKVLLRAVRAATPEDEGILRKAQTSKLITKSDLITGLVGADVDKLRAASDAEGVSSSGKLRRPINIDWLVENGHVAPDGTFVPPSGRMKQTAEATMPSAEAAFTRTLAREIEREALK